MDTLPRILTEGARLAVISGAFGTGKTEVAINLALRLQEEGRSPVTLVDLDIVNLYFRSRQRAYDLESRGIKVVSSVDGMENADMPALSPAIAACFDRKDGQIVFDLGGSDLGGIVAAYFHRGLSAEPANHWLVVNPFRPFNETAAATLEMAEKIEQRSRLPITGIIANPHLINETTASVIDEGLARVLEIARYPVVSLAVMEDYYEPASFDSRGLPVLVMRKQMKQPWEPGGIMMAGKRGKRWE
jgi:hypothetical protein